MARLGNRLRLTGDLPITLAAECDGALLPDWQERDEAVPRRKGYSLERPWGFLDPRTQRARDLGKVLRARLGATEGGLRVGIVGNGCRFAYRAFARAAVDAGLEVASVKVFAPEPHRANVIAQASGAHAEVIAGLKVFRAARADVAIEVGAPLHAFAIESFARHAALARDLGADQNRIEVALDAIGLSRLAHAARAIERLAAACAREGMPLEASLLSASTRHFDRVVVHHTAWL